MKQETKTELIKLLSKLWNDGHLTDVGHMELSCFISDNLITSEASDEIRDVSNNEHQKKICDVCNGDGFIEKHLQTYTCKTCNGVGKQID